MSASLSRRNNVLAGTFLIGTLLVTVVLAFLLSGVAERLGSFERYTIWFPLSIGAPGIKPGSPVNLGGQAVGRVEAVRRDLTGADGPRILLDVVVASDLELRPDAKAFLEQPLLGTLSAINIRYLGSPEAGPPLGAGSLIEGGIAPPAFLESAGFGPEQQTQVQNIIDRVEQITDEFYASLERTDAQIQPVLESAERIAAEVEALVNRVSGEMDGWTADVDATLANIRAGSERIDPVFDQIETALADADAAIASVQAAIDENRPNIDAIIANAEQTTRTINEQTMPLVHSTIEDYRAPAGDFADSMGDVRMLIAEEVPNLRRTIANLRLASDQLKLTLAEVRAAPWRLLERPTTRELEAQLFYDATRTYAEAVSDLRAASEALSAARATGSARPEVLQGLLDHLEESFRRYQQAETRMLEQIPRTSE